MEAKDLMIGDWVNIYVFPNENPQKEDLFPARISTIMTPLPSEDSGEHCECQFVATDGGVGCASRRIETCLPIPLTPEILEKNGWKKEIDKEEYRVKYMLGEQGKNCWMMWSCKYHIIDIQRQDEKLDMYNLCITKVCVPCEYVHQLQQALRLSELTDLADNFKV